MSRSSRCEFERRVDDVYDLLVSRVTWRAVISYCTARWGVSERQAGRYMAAARQRVRELLDLHSKTISRKHWPPTNRSTPNRWPPPTTARPAQTLDSIVKLSGLAAPERIELYDFSSYSDKQLAEEVARELPELIHEAERLTGGAARRTQNKSPPDEPLDPPHPDS